MPSKIFMDGEFPFHRDGASVWEDGKVLPKDGGDGGATM